MKKEKKAILIIDDDKSVLKIYTRILQKEGYDTDTAETGEEAMEKASNRFYHLALVDMKLPDINGNDLLTRIHVAHPKMIKIMITGFPTVEDGVKALDRGADAYLVKPVKTEELLTVIKEKLKKEKETDLH